MPVDPSGPVALPLENLRILLSNCPGWQTWTGKPDQAGAYRHVYLVDLPPPATSEPYTVGDLEQLRPFAVIDEFELENDRPGGDGWVGERDALGAWHPSGRLLLRFEDDVPDGDADDPAAAKLKFMNNVGAALKDLIELGSGEGDYLSVHRVARHHPWRRSDETVGETQGDFMTVSYVVTWGI